MIWGEWLWRGGLAGAGAALIVLTLLSAIRTFVLPRGARDGIVRLVFNGMRLLFRAWLWPRRGSAQAVDRVMALYAPLSLLTLPAVWLLLLGVGYALLLHALVGFGWTRAVVFSGSALLTLGLEGDVPLAATLLGFATATSGFAILTLLIAYLPTLNTAFSARERLVTLLGVRAGTPSTGWALLEWHARLGHPRDLGPFWAEWEGWFAELAEQHTSLGSLVFFRSPDPRRSWVTAAGAVLDAAALAVANLEREDEDLLPALLCLHTGRESLTQIADYFHLLREAPPETPISITRQEFETASRRLASAGYGLAQDRDRAWQVFERERRGYDQALLALAAFVIAPLAPWSSDRVLVWPRERQR